jgi:hypothetical protein
MPVRSSLGLLGVVFLSVVFLSVVLAAGSVTLASASEPVLTVDVGGTTRKFTREQLLRNPSIAEIDVARDSA